MVQKVSIRNFKSVKELAFEARKVNVFIGQPNSGKSNILEALGLLSFIGAGSDLGTRVRFKHPAELFFDRDASSGSLVEADKFIARIILEGRECRLEVSSDGNTIASARMGLDGQGGSGSYSEKRTPFRPYTFDASKDYKGSAPGPLEIPHGTNLVGVLTSNKSFRQGVKELLASKGLKLQFHVGDSELSVAKDLDDLIYSYSYPTVSETLRRIIFYMAVLESNRDAVVILDEPESHTFPFYTKYLAERIGLDPTNQFFLSTHNPYLLQSIVQKTPVKDLAIFITYMRDYQTRLRQLTDAETASLLDPPTGSVADVFFNLEKFIEG